VIYLDSCVLIYYAEDPDGLGALAAKAMAATSLPVCISPLVMCECLVKPIRHGDAVTRGYYERMFLRFTALDMPEPVYFLAAELRARHGLKTPDALHLACAQHHRCEAVWTNDDRLMQASRGMARNIFAPRRRTKP